MLGVLFRLRESLEQRDGDAQEMFAFFVRT